jgi:hypothetical protein
VQQDVAIQPYYYQVYRGCKFYPSVLETVGVRVPTRYIEDLSLFNVCSSSENCPLARRASVLFVEALMCLEKKTVFSFILYSGTFFSLKY